MKNNKIRSLVIFAAGLALCAGWAPPARGQTPPGLINFQGRLTDAANNPLSGAQDFVFEIYDAPAGGVRLWTETQTAVPVANGVLAAQLGAAVPVPASVFSSPAAYLQITVGGVTLAPRQRLVTAPYAFNSYSLQGRGYDAFVSTDAASQSIAGNKTFTGVLASAQLRLAGGVVISSEAAPSLGGGVRVSSNVYIVGFSSAAKYYGDGSGLTGISVPGDNLGSHTASQDLNMAGRQILNVASMTITGKDSGSGYSLYLSSGLNMAGGTVNAGLFVGSGAGLSGVLASSVAAGGVRPGSLATGAVSASAQLADGVITLAKFGQSGCAASQVPKWNGAAWACAADVGTDYLADEASLHLSGGVFSARPSSVTLQGNSFNGASQLLRLTPGGALPALNGAALLAISSVAANSVRDEAIVSVSGSKVAGDISGAAGSVANGVYTTGSYSDPSWIRSLGTGKINLSTVTAALDLKADASALAGKLPNTATVPPGLVDLSTVSAALAGKLDTGAQAASVANGVYTTGSYSDPSWITALATGKINLSTVTAALDLKADASALAGKLSNTATVPPGLVDLSTVSAALAGKLDTGAQAASVANGVYTTGSYSDPSWITSLSTAKINLSTVTAALDLKADASALAGKLSNTATVPPGLVDLSTVTAALAAGSPNGVYTTGSYSDPAWITSLSTAKINLSTVTAALDLKADASALAGKLSNTATVPPGLVDLSTVSAALAGKLDTGAQAASVANGVYTTGSYSDPSWITRLGTGKIDLSTVTAALNGKLDAGAQAASVANGVYTTGSYSDPSWITRLGTGKIDLSTVTAALNGKLDAGAQAASVANGVYTTGDQTIAGNKTFSSTIAGSVSGNAATSTKLNSQGDYANGTPGTTRGPAGLNLFQVYNNGYPIPYGNVLHIGGGGAGQLLVGWSGVDGSHTDNYVRSKRDNDAGAWSPWAKLLTDVNYGSYAPGLTGAGASGTWGINVTGNSAGFTGSLAGDVSGTQGATVVADDSHNHHYALGTYISGGGEAPNYFGSDKLKLQMLTCPWTWCDTLWMSSYGGGDVKGSNQLVFSKYGANAGFRRQDYDSGTWGTLYEFIHTGNMGTLLPLQSLRDFTVGTLIQSDIDYSVSDGEPFLLEIEGNSYGSAIPFDIKLQGYIYSNTIINHGAVSNGTNITGLVAFNYGGKLCFWFPRQAYWQGVTVVINSSYAGVKRNRVVSITDSAKPGGITKEVAFTIQQGLNTGNLTALSGRTLPLGNDYPVSKMLRWKNYGSGHVIFDASNGTSPEGGAVNQTNSDVAWSASYPTLMGWNGSNTYGVRVDMARYANDADAVDGHHFNWSGQSGQPSWLWGGNDSTNMYVYNPSNFSVNYANSAANVTSLAGTWWGVNMFGSNRGGGSYVGGQSNYGLQAFSSDAGAAGMSFHRGGYYAVNMGLDPDNVLRIGGWSAPSSIWQLDMSGNMYLNGVGYAQYWDYISNRRSKTDITDNNYGIAEVMRLQARNYKLIADKTGRPQIGFIAEEVEEVIPELVSHNAEGLAMGMDYGRLTAVLTEAIKDQQVEIEKLKAENAAIKLRLTALESK